MGCWRTLRGSSGRLAVVENIMAVSMEHLTEGHEVNFAAANAGSADPKMRHRLSAFGMLSLRVKNMQTPTNDNPFRLENGNGSRLTANPLEKHVRGQTTSNDLCAIRMYIT